MEDHISHPTAKDYQEYGTLRQEEAQQVLVTLGVEKENIVFLGFPDGGLCSIFSAYRSDERPIYTSPLTLRDRPVPADVLLPNTKYDSEDLEREIERVLSDFRPTLVVTTHPRDQHPDHCSTYFFVKKTLQGLEKKDPTSRPHSLTFLIHFGQWPMGEGAGLGSRLYPPRGFPEQETKWLSFSLSPVEVEAKRRALLLYHSQMLVMGRYLMSFARANELFLLDQGGTAGKRDGIACCGK